VAEHVTKVTPIGNVEPDGEEQDADNGPSTVSIADAVKVARAPPGPVASRVMLAGTVTSGAVVSRTVTVNVAVATFPWASVAVQSTRVVPSENMNPDDGLQVAVTGPSTMSVAPTENGTVAPPEPVASAMMSAGTSSDGGVVSTTRIVNVAEPVFPCASVAVQLTTVLPIVNRDPDVGEQEGKSAPSTRSEALAENVTTAPPGPVASAESDAGTVSDGRVVSTTWTVKEAEATFPEKSVAVHVTSVSPRGNEEPDAWSQETWGLGSTRSMADGGEYVATAPEPLVASLVMSAETARDGGVVSTTVTWNEALAEFPCESVAEQTIVVRPSANVDPDAGLHDTNADPSTRSEAEAENVTRAPPGPVASTVRSEGTLRTGGVVSRIVTVNVRVAVLPAKSAAVHETEVTPKGNVDPDAGEQTRELRPLTESEADAEYVTEAPAEDVASATIGEGSVRVGGVVSIRIVNGPAVAVFPVLSVAEQVNVCTPCVAIVTDPVASFLSLDKEKLTVPSVHAIAVAFESS